MPADDETLRQLAARWDRESDETAAKVRRDMPAVEVAGLSEHAISLNYCADLLRHVLDGGDPTTPWRDVPSGDYPTG